MRNKSAQSKHFHLYPTILAPVGANPCVSPRTVSTQKTLPLHADISTPPADRTPTFSAKKRHDRKPMHHVRMCANHFHKRIPSESCQSLLPRRRWHTACDGGDLIVLG